MGGGLRVGRSAVQAAACCSLCALPAGAPAAFCRAGRDGAKAFDYLSQALELAEAELAGGGGGDGSSAGAHLPPLAPPTAETASEGDVPPPLSAEEVVYSARTWLGR